MKCIEKRNPNRPTRKEMAVPSLKAQTLQICKRYPEVALFEGEFFEVEDDGSSQIPSGRDSPMMNLTLPDGDGGYLQFKFSVNSLAIREDFYLPAHLCEPIFQAILETRPANFMIAFRDKSRCQLTRLDLSNKKIRIYQDYVTALFCHNLTEIDFSRSFLAEETAVKLEVMANSLKTLKMSQTMGTWISNHASFLMKLEKLEKLDMSFGGSGMSQCLESISKLKNLVWLNLSGCDFHTLVPLKDLAGSLQHLYLYEACQELESPDELAEIIPIFKKLTHLDISQDIQGRKGESFLDAELLQRIGSLPALEYLDISGSTQLSLEGFQGLKEGLNRRIKFLGLFFINPDNYEDFPAEKIASFNNEEQLLTALAVYVNRSQYMEKALASLYTFVDGIEIEEPERTLKLVLAASEAHLSDELVQRPTGLCIATILKMHRDEHLSKELRKATITTVLDIIESHKNIDILRICIQCLCFFDVPDELGFVGYRLCRQLLVLMKEYKSFHLTLPCLQLFNAMVCHTADMKVKVGRLNAVKIILKIIDDKVKRSLVDRVLETAWLALWNVTDESDDNCKAFIQNNGLELFIDCLEEFHGETDLQSSLLGLMGNIAEVRGLRFHLMERKYIGKFVDLLSDDNHLEVRYNAAGVLSHICSDGENAWTLNKISRAACMEKVTASITSWNIGASRNIKYRSLKPILRLVPCFDTPCAQEWAVWALANLTKVYPDKYCKLLVDEGGVQLLQEITNSTQCSENLEKHAAMILNKIEVTVGKVLPMEID